VPGLYELRANIAPGLNIVNLKIGDTAAFATVAYTIRNRATLFTVARDGTRTTRIHQFILPLAKLRHLLSTDEQTLQPQNFLEASSSKWVLVSSALALAALAALWLPGKGYVLAHAKDPESLNIEMWRTDCQIRCPVYKVTIHGNGTVDYVGDHFVRDRGPEEVVISKDQIHTLLVDFDQAHFFNLEDRAFAWGFHASRVGVRITIDGKTKEVWSDTYHTGSKSGLQARFVEATAAIDKVVGTDQ
jgi:hypothetical protein